VSAAPPPLRWWGWGDRATQVPPGLTRLMHEEIGLEPAPAQIGPPATVTLPHSALADDSVLGRLRAACGIDAVRLDDETRLRHAGGRSYLDLLRLRSGDISCAPDAVVLPADEASPRSEVPAGL